MSALPLLDRLQALAEQAKADTEAEHGLPPVMTEAEQTFYAASLEAVPLLIQACRAAADYRAVVTPYAHEAGSAAGDRLDAALAPLAGSGDSGE